MGSTSESDSRISIAQKLAGSFSHCALESVNERKPVHNLDSILRDKTVVESFSLIKGSGTVQIMFEKIPLWLSVLSPMFFHVICFTQFKSLSELSSISKEASVFVNSYLVLWDKSRIHYSQNCTKSPNLVLISGSSSFLATIRPSTYEAPVICCLECKSRWKIRNHFFEIKEFRHSTSGGCTNAVIELGFFGINPPNSITNIKRTLGDFLDYSVLPHKRITESQLPSFLGPDDVLSMSRTSTLIALPTYKFKSKLGVRNLTRKELCGIIGLSALQDSSLSTDQLWSFLPVQPLSLILKSYLVSIPSKSRVQFKENRSLPLISVTTHFPHINQTINDSWTDSMSDESRSKKADKAPVPSELWDRRLILSFPNRNGVIILANGLRKLCLRWHIRNIFLSFITYLRSTYSTQLDLYMSGLRGTQIMGGGFLKSVEMGRDVIKRASLASWFEWIGGSSLIFWRWNCFMKEARDGFKICIKGHNLQRSSKKVLKSSPPSDRRLKSLYLDKLQRVVDVGYLESGYVRWDIRLFGVPKGEEDIRIVYDGTSSGINDEVWAPSFFLPSSVSLARILEVNTC